MENKSIKDCDTCGHAYPDPGVSNCSWPDGCDSVYNIWRGWTPRNKLVGSKKSKRGGG